MHEHVALPMRLWQVHMRVHVLRGMRVASPACAGRAGVRVTLDGAESSDHVTVEAADDMLSSRKRRRRPQNSD